jgi:hypothetical protein
MKSLGGALHLDGLNGTAQAFEVLCISMERPRTHEECRGARVQHCAVNTGLAINIFKDDMSLLSKRL